MGIITTKHFELTKLKDYSNRGSYFEGKGLKYLEVYQKQKQCYNILVFYPGNGQVYSVVSPRADLEVINS
jgi:hypothetical protein